MADKKIISSSKKEIYTKLLDIAEKYTDIKDTDFLKTGLFGYITESMAMMIRDSSFHKTMLYNESFLNTAVIPKSVYNWAKMFNVEVQSANPTYAEIEIRIPTESIDAVKNTKFDEKYGLTDTNDLYIILDKEDPIIIGGYYFSLEHSIAIYKKSSSYSAKYILTEYASTNFQSLNGNDKLSTKMETSDDTGSQILVIYARAYQYKRTVITKQITSNSFLNKVQRYEFDDQFCGAKLFYKDGNEQKEVSLTYSDLSTSSSSLSAFYNLSNENELELIFKTGENYFMPSSNSQLTLYLYTTKGADVPKQITDDGIISFSNADLKSLPVVVSFNPTSLIGGKNMPSLSTIKETIINEISTRNTITTKSDLNNYFNILTTLIEDVNDGKVTFTKKRDDILRRIYNAYLLLRDNSDDSREYSTADSGYLSSCVPTNTIPYAVINTSSINDYTDSSTFVKLPFPKFSSEGNMISDSNDSYFICPFYIYIDCGEIPFVKYIYNMTDSSSSLVYDATNYKYSGDKTFIPEKIRLYRGFSNDNVIKAADEYLLTLTFKTNFELKTEDVTVKDDGLTISGKVSSVTTKKIASIESTLNDDESYTINMTWRIDVNSDEFNYETDHANTINLGQDKASFNESEKLTIDFGQISISGDSLTGLVVTSTEELTFFQPLDDIMESSLIRKDLEEQRKDNDGNLLYYTDANKTEITTTQTSYPVYNILFGLAEVPVVHSSFFNSSYSNRREGFISQLFTYINILKENLNKLETSTFFNLKFYNTYGDSVFYDTPYTNVRLGMTITLKSAYKDNTSLMNEIRSYVRKIFDKMNESQSFSFSEINALLMNTKTYGNYIDHITFDELNGGLEQYISKLSDISEADYPPEWLNLDADYLFPSSGTGTESSNSSIKFD